MSRLPVVPLALAAASIAASAHAWAPGPQAETALAAGQAWSEVLSDPGHSSGVVHAAVDIAAPPATVWRVMTDCAHAPRLVVNLKSCRVIDRDPLGRWDVREHISKGGLIMPAVRSVFRSEYDKPRTITFHRVGGDLKVLEGSWRLEPLNGGTGTRVIYETRVAANFAAPAPIVRQVLRHDVPKALTNLRAASLDQTGGAAMAAAR